MIKRFIKRLFGKPGAEAARPVFGTRREIAVEEHGIDPALLDERAVRVVRTLKDAGHEAYIVGGAVRDLLVGRRPKDFDVATDATPEQVKALFRRAFIIGRRFRIVHVIHGRGRDHEVIEVSTFRAYLDAADADQVDGNERTARADMAGKQHVVDAEGRVLRDNVWGPQVEDAARRDFTVNAMYYDPTTQVVVDYHGGLADVRQHMLRMIGDAATRYREDPVRVLRAVRFAAKLGFEIEPATLAPMRQAATLLANIPASRLFDEMIKLLQTGHALASVAELRRHELLRLFAPLDVLAAPTRDAATLRFVELALADTDRRIADGRSVVPSFMLACLLWHEVESRWRAARDAGEQGVAALHTAIDAVFEARIGDISGRGRLAADMREIWLMQPRFDRRSGRGPYALVEQPRYRAAYDFLRLRADAGQAGADLAEWWEDFFLGSAEEREAMIAALREQQGPRRGRRGGAEQPAEAGAADADEPGAPAEAGTAARRRRRRRRRPDDTPPTTP